MTDINKKIKYNDIPAKSLNVIYNAFCDNSFDYYYSVRSGKLTISPKKSSDFYKVISDVEFSLFEPATIPNFDLFESEIELPTNKSSDSLILENTSDLCLEENLWGLKIVGYMYIDAVTSLFQDNFREFKQRSKDIILSEKFKNIDFELSDMIIGWILSKKGYINILNSSESMVKLRFASSISRLNWRSFFWNIDEEGDAFLVEATFDFSEGGYICDKSSICSDKSILLALISYIYHESLDYIDIFSNESSDGSQDFLSLEILSRSSISKIKQLENEILSMISLESYTDVSPRYTFALINCSDVEANAFSEYIDSHLFKGFGFSVESKNYTLCSKTKYSSNSVHVFTGLNDLLLDNANAKSSAESQLTINLNIFYDNLLKNRGRSFTFVPMSKDFYTSYFSENRRYCGSIHQTIHLDEYTDEDYYRIFEWLAKENNLYLEENICENLSSALNEERKISGLKNYELAKKVFDNTFYKKYTQCCVKDNVIRSRDICVMRKKYSDDLLDSMIGLSGVKENILRFKSYLEFVKKASFSRSDYPLNLHMMFKGNPGTGKTTVARKMSQILFSLGYTKENKLIEVSRKDLVGEYVGQTAPKVQSKIDEAIGGVLFIDEAYSLVSKSKNDFGSEAISTLIKAMEDKKGELVVIFAGYGNEMDTFIQSNPGINSRIGYVFEFNDYTPIELYQMVNKKLEHLGMTINDCMENDIIDFFEEVSSRKDFGNGRFVDNWVQDLVMTHAMEISAKELSSKSIMHIEDSTVKKTLVFESKNKILYRPMGFFR